MGKTMIVKKKKSPSKSEGPSKLELKIKTNIQSMDSDAFMDYLKSNKSIFD